MRNLKRVLSMALASVMVLGLTVVGASAANFNDQAEIKHTTAAAVMSAIGVLEGNEKGDFMPDQVLTREQAAKIICYMLMGPENAEKLGASGTKFSDVAADRWSAPYISYCANMGILVGDGTGKFNPEGELTGHAFAKMLLVALGYDAKVQKYEGDAWAINVATDAVNAGIFVNGTVLSDALSRDNAAQMAFQTLTADMVKYDTKGSDITIGDITISGNASAPEKVTVSSTEAGYNGEKDGIQQFCEKYFSDLKKVVNDTDSFGRPAATWYYGKLQNSDTEVTTAAESADYTVVVSKAGKSQSYWLEEANKNLKTNSDTEVFLNGSKASVTYQIGDVIELYVNSDDGKTVETIVVSRYTPDVITEVDTDVDNDDAEDGVTAYVTFEDAGTFKNTDIAGFNADTYVEDAVVALIEGNDDDIIASYVAESVEGAISAYSSANKTYTLDGTKYTLSGAVADEINGNVDFDDGVYTLYLDANGYVIKTAIVEGSATLDDVNYIVYKWADPNNGSYGVQEYKYYAQIVALDGTIAEIEITGAQFLGLKAPSEKVTSDNFDSLKSNLYIIKAGAKVSVSGESFDASATYYVEDTAAAINSDLITYTTNSKGVSTIKTWSKDDDNTAKTETTDGSVVFKTGSAYIKLTTSGDRYYLNSKTNYVFVEGSKSDLDVTVKTGGIAYTVPKSTDVTVIYSKSGNSNVASYVIIPTDDYKADSEGDYLYVNDNTEWESVKGGYEMTVYDMDGKALTIVSENKPESSNAFYTYSIDEDEVYTLTKVGSSSDLLTNKTFVGTYNGLMTIDGLDNDLDANDAVIVDLHNKTADGTYSKSVSTLSAMAKAAEDGYTVKLDIMLSNTTDDIKPVAVIFVTSVKSADATVKSVTASVEAQSESTLKASDVKVALSNSDKTIRVTVENAPTLKNNDKIVLSVVAANDGAKVDYPTVTLTYNGSNWNIDHSTVQVTPADGGSAVSYTVSVAD